MRLFRLANQNRPSVQTPPEQPEDDYADTVRFGPLLLSDEEVVLHTLAFGATGSGKSTLLRLMMQDVVPEIQPGSDWRMLITNPKRDAMSVLHGMSRSGVRIVTTDPFDKRGLAWDMCRDVRDPRTALQLVWTLVPDRQETQPFFTNATRHLLYGVLLSFIDRGLKWTFADLLRAVRRPTDLKRVLKASRYTSDLIHQYFYDKRLVGNIISTVATCLLPFEPVAAAWDSAHESISFEDWVKEEGVLVLGSSDVSRKAVEVINRCMFRRAVDLTLDLTESTTRRSWFMLDEVSECGRLDGLVSLLKRGRSKGAAVVIAAQSIAGLRDPNLYGPHGAAEIVGQIMHKFIGRLECPETAKWASEIFGEQEIRQITQSTSEGVSRSAQGGGSSSSVTQQEQIVTRAAVMPSEFMSVPPCNDIDGLTAFYLSGASGAFQANLPGEQLFHHDLMPPSQTEPDFLPRDVASQYLEPWPDDVRARDSHRRSNDRLATSISSQHPRKGFGTKTAATDAR